MGAGLIGCCSCTYRPLNGTMCIISSTSSDASKTFILPQNTTNDVGIFAWPHQRLGTAYESRNQGVVERTNSSNSSEYPAQSLGGDRRHAGALKAFEFEMRAGVHDGAEITCIPWLVQNCPSHSRERRPPASCLSPVSLHAATLHYVLQISRV
jgi:hypothetical protein